MMQTDVRPVATPVHVSQMAIPSVVALMFVALAFIVYGHVFSDGLCCADDSTNAIVAKNLAFGKGYTNSISFDGPPGMRTFDPEISTGPTLNLPAAVMIYFFGNVPWAPGFVTATVSLSLLLLAFFSLSKMCTVSRAASYIGIFILFLYGTTAGKHFAQWYSLIGELPAALLCLVGAISLATQPDRRSVIVWSSLLYGLALTTKLLALLSVIPIAMWFMSRVVIAKSDRLERVRDGLSAGIAFVTPCMVFQAWQLSVLGTSSYLTSVKEFWRIFRSDSGTFALANVSLFWSHALQNYSSHSNSMQQHFGYSPLILLVASLILGALIYHLVEQRGLRLLFTWLMAGALTNAAWWLLVSPGWPRHALIGLWLYFAAISCAVFIIQSWLAVGVIAPLLLMVFATGYPMVTQPVTFVRATKFSYRRRVTNLMKTVALLNTLQGDKPFVMGWWATAVDIEYAMPSIDNFIQSNHVDQARENRSLILVRNSTWVDFGRKPEFTAWENKCNEVLLKAPPYLVSRCPGRDTK